MTKPLLFLTALACAVVSFAAGTAPVNKNVNLSWDYDTNNVVDAFKLYTSTNIATPTTNWALVGTVSGNVYSITLSNIPTSQSWYFVTASNWSGESVPSNIVGTPQIPGAVSNLRITLK